MTISPDTTPDTSNRLAYWLGRVFHPYLICIPTLIAVLSEMQIGDIFKWTGIIIGILIVPNAVLLYMLSRQGKFAYQRTTRTPIYLLGWISLLLATAILIIFNGPRILFVCLVTLLIWIPIQLFINTKFTKISTHTAVVAGCGLGLFMLGKLNHPLLMGIVITIAVLTAWARVKTKNHTLTQVILGLLLGGGSVLVVFPLLLR